MAKEIEAKQINIGQLAAQQKFWNVVSLTLRYVFLILVAISVLFPFYWMIISSLKTIEEYRLAVPTFWPQTLDFKNYAEAFEVANL